MAKVYAGEIVSCGYGMGTVVTGRIVEVPRRSDGRVFLMVQITSGLRQGERSWPDHWDLGVGPHQGTCERCNRRFRFQPGEVGHTCQRCWNLDEVTAQRRSANPERPRTSFERKQLRDRGDREKEPVTT